MEQAVAETLGGTIAHGSDEAFIGKAGNGGHQRVCNSDAVRAVGACLTQALHGLPQAATKAHRYEQTSAHQLRKFRCKVVASWLKFTAVFPLSRIVVKTFSQRLR